MFVSMVASPGKASAQIMRSYEQRFNVALSRARDRMYLFRSVKPEDLSNPRDLKLRVINHFQNPMPVPQAEATQLIELCESGFEKDVFRRLVNLGYRVTPQVGVGDFRIDLVVDGEEDRRLAVELDGDRYHGPDRWLDDWNRQKILERVGWRFWRCWWSSFTLDPDGCMEELLGTLRQMKIEPIGYEDGHHPYTEHRTVTAELTRACETRAAEEEAPEPVAEIGDKLLVSFNGQATRRYTLTLSKDKEDIVNGVVSIDGPTGKSLFGASVEDEVEILWKGETRRATVLRIDKSAAGSATEPTANSTGEAQTVPDAIGKAGGTPLAAKPPTSSPLSSTSHSQPPRVASRAYVSAAERKAILATLDKAGKPLVMWRVAEGSAIGQRKLEEILPVLVDQGLVKRVESADAVRYSRA